MILIFGMRARAKTIGTGEFFCAHCGADRSYVLQAIRRWFTLFFIPIFPVGKVLGEQVRCTTCHTAFRPEVVQAPTSSEFSESLRGATRYAAVAMLQAGDRADAAARRAAIDAARRMGAEQYDDAWLDQDLAALDGSQLGQYLPSLAQGLNLQGKESFVEQVARVGVAGGPLSSAQSDLLDALGTALGLSVAHVRGIVVTAAAAQTPPTNG